MTEQWREKNGYRIMKSKLFVYGTLMKKSDHPMSQFLFENAKHLGEAVMKGDLYKISWYPGAIFDSHSEGLVYGELFEVEDDFVLFKKLDEYEGVGSQFASPNEYKRMQVTVSFEGVEMLSWFYNYNIPIDGASRIVSGNFLEQ